MPTYINRISPSSTYINRVGTQSDLGYGLDFDLAIMTDEAGNRIVFHTGTFYSIPSTYTTRIIPI